MSRTGKPETPSAGPPGSERPGQSAVGSRAMPVDARRVLLAGTAGWGLAFLVLLPFWNWLGEHQHRVWLWTALAGTVLGLLALPLVRRHRDEGRLG